MKIMYGKRCAECGGKDILNNGHLKQFHQVKSNTKELIERLQGKNKNSAKADLRNLLKLVINLSKTHEKESPF